MLPRSRHLVALLATLTAVAALTAALTTVPSSAVAATTPRVGQCHRLTVAQIMRPNDTARPVGCQRRHTTQTVAVPSLPSLAGLSHDEMSPLGMRACFQAVAKALGRTSVKRSLTAYGFVFFFPTAAEIAAGAHWVRCDVILMHGRSMARLTGRLKRPIVPRHPTDEVRLCMTRGGAYTSCDRRHAFRAVKAVPVRGATFPSDDEFYAASGRCGRRADVFTTPLEAAWDSGDHNIVCFARTAS